MLKNLERCPIAYSFEDSPFAEHQFVLVVFFRIKVRWLLFPLRLHVFLNQFGILNFYPFTIVTWFVFTFVDLHWKRLSLGLTLHRRVNFETLHLFWYSVDGIKTHELLGLWGFLNLFNWFWELCFLVWLEAEFSSRTLAAVFVASKRKLWGLFCWLHYRWSHCSTGSRHEGREKIWSLKEGFFFWRRRSSEFVFVLAHLH